MAENYKSFDWSMLRADRNRIYPTAQAYWGPYNSIASAFETIAGALGENIPLGLKFGVISGGKIEEYWFQTGYTIDDITQCNISQEEEDRPYIVDLQQTVESTESGGINTWTATMSDGTFRQFNVRNGQKGEDGEDGQDGKDGKDGQDGAGAQITIDGALDINSENPVQNKVIVQALEDKADENHTHTTSQISDWSSATAGFLTQHQDISGKQDKLTAGQNITIDENGVISAQADGTVIVDDELSTDSTHPVQNKVITTALNAKADAASVPTKTSDLQNDAHFITAAEVPSSTSNFIGTFGSVNDLPIPAASGNYAYVQNTTTNKYDYYYFNGTVWSSTGATVDTNNLTADEEDITASEVGVLSLKNRDSSNGKGIVRIRKNPQPIYVIKKYDNPVYIHAVEDTSRGDTQSSATTIGDYNAGTDYFNGNPAPYVAPSQDDPVGNPNGLDLYGKAIGFPMSATHKKSVRKASPKVILNTAQNKFYFSWKHNSTSVKEDGSVNIWSLADICFDEWYEKPSDLDLTIENGKTFAYVVNGITHYVHRDNNAWTIDETEQKTVNLVTQSDFNISNTIYEIAYDIDLNGQLITIPEGCTLKYAGGKIMNGKINMINDTHIDCPDVQFFEEVQVYNAYADVMKDVWFDNIWYAMSGEKIEDQRYSLMSQISLSKNYTLDFKYFNFIVQFKTYSKKTDLFHIIGNDHIITIDTTYMPGGCTFVKTFFLAIEDLEIREKQSSDASVLPTELNCLNAVFDAYNIKLKNFKYMGYSRLAGNYSGVGEVNASITLINCDIKVQSFAFEAYYNAVVMKDTKIDFIDGAQNRTQYGTILSIGAYPRGADESDVQWFRYYVDIQDCYIGGPWELCTPRGIAVNDEKIHNVEICNSSYGGVKKYLSYPWMKFRNCTLKNFNIGLQDTSKNGLGNTDITFDGCHFISGKPIPGFNRINDVTFNHCEMDMTNYNSGIDGGPFCFTGVRYATFNNCTFKKIKYRDTNNGEEYNLPSNNTPIITARNTRPVFKLYLYGNKFISSEGSNDFKIAYNSTSGTLGISDILERTVMAGNYFAPEYSYGHAVYAVTSSSSFMLPVNDTVIDSTIMQYNFGTTDMSLCQTDFNVVWRTASDSLYYAGKLARGYYSAVLGKFLFVRENAFPYSYYESDGIQSSIDGLTLFYRKKGMARAGDMTWAKITNNGNTLCNKQLIYNGTRWLAPVLNDWRLRRSGTAAVMEEMKKYASELGTTFFNTSDNKMYYLSSAGTFPTFTITINSTSYTSGDFWLRMTGTNNNISSAWSKFNLPAGLTTTADIAKAIADYFNYRDHAGDGYEIIEMSASENIVIVICNVRTTGVSCALYADDNFATTLPTTTLNYTIDASTGSPSTWTAF